MTGSNAMELDDMKTAWQTLDRRLDAQAAFNMHMFKEGKLDRLRRGLRPLIWGQAIQIAVGALIALWGGGFWVDHRHEPQLLIAGLLLHAAGISMIALGALMLTLISRIDYSAPVLTIQRQLLQLRKVYVGGGLAVGLPWWVLWIPFAEVAAQKVAFAPSFLAINYAVGIVGVLLTLAFLRWMKNHPRLAKRLEDGAAGRSINKAQVYLEEISRFEQE